MAHRAFSMEGALHLYSSPPSVLTPGDIYLTASLPDLRDQLIGSNIYVITCRPRISVDPDHLVVEGDMLCGFLIAATEDGWRKFPFRYRLSFEHHLGRPDRIDVSVYPNGTHVLVSNTRGKILIAAHVIVSVSDCEIPQEAKDLHVLYVGQSMGRDGKRLAVDRLLHHTKFQRILAEFHTRHPEMELLILLYRFEHSKKMISSGGDLSLTPSASAREDMEHMQRMQKSSFERRKRIALAEAALINHFKPSYNVTFTQTDFASPRKFKFLQTLITQDMAGLIVEINAINIRARLRSEYQSHANVDPETLALMRNLIDRPDCSKEARDECEQIMGSHFIQIPLTSSEDRNSFLHGIQWLDEAPQAGVSSETTTT